MRCDIGRHSSDIQRTASCYQTTMRLSAKSDRLPSEGLIVGLQLSKVERWIWDIVPVFSGIRPPASFHNLEYFPHAVSCFRGELPCPRTRASNPGIFLPNDGLPEPHWKRMQMRTSNI